MEPESASAAVNTAIRARVDVKAIGVLIAEELETLATNVVDRGREFAVQAATIIASLVDDFLAKRNDAAYIRLHARARFTQLAAMHLAAATQAVKDAAASIVRSVLSTLLSVLATA